MCMIPCVTTLICKLAQPVPVTECPSEDEANNLSHIASLIPYRVLGSSDSRGEC